MARTVGDAALMLDVISGEHPADPHSLGGAPLDTLSGLQGAAKDAGRLKIAWRALVGNTLLDDEIRNVCERALDVFRELGCTVEVRDDPVENAEPAWRILQQSNWAARFYARMSDVQSKIDPSFADGIWAGGEYSGQQLLQATYKRTQHFRTVQSWFADYDLVLTPTCSRPPLSVEARALDPIKINGVDAGDMRQSWVPYLNLFDLTGHPAISIPCGFTKDGLPVGLQIVGRWHQDEIVLRAAAAFEAELPWAHRVPSSLQST